MTQSEPIALVPEETGNPAVIVRVEDIRAAQLCFQGARPWFRRHGLDWQAFLAHGIPADRLAATGDAPAFRVIAVARDRIARAGRDGQTDGR